MVSYWKRMIAMASCRKNKRLKSKQQHGPSVRKSSMKSSKKQQQHRQSGRKFRASPMTSPKQQLEGCDSCSVLKKHQGVSESSNSGSQLMRVMESSNCGAQLSNNYLLDMNINTNSRKTMTCVNTRKFMTSIDTNCFSSKHMLRRSIHHLSEDLLSEIFKRLPVKYILRCRCVHKSWHSLIQSHSFITLHLNYQKTHSSNLLLFRNSFDNQLTIRFDEVQCKKYCPVNYLPALPESLWLVHSYGLICVSYMFEFGHNYDSTIYLWNPLLEKYKTLPKSPLYTSFTFKPYTNWTALAFGFVPQVNDYMVVHIMKNPSEINPDTVVIGVYSLNTNSWKMTSQENVFISCIPYTQVVFVNGVAYWVGFISDLTKGMIMCFSAETNLLREIPLPSCAKYMLHSAHLFLHPFGQSISYFVDDEELKHFDMWVLREDSENEFLWEKKMSVDLSDHFREEVLGVRNNCEPIFFKLYNFISYNLDSNEANDFVESWDTWEDFSFYEENYAPPYYISPFVESLVLLNND